MFRQPAFRVTVAIAASVAVGGCGGVEPSERASSDGAPARARTARFEALSVEREGDVELSDRCLGAIDLERRRYRLACTNSAADDLEYQVIRVGSNEFVRMRETGDPGSTPRKWHRTGVDADRDPLTWLDPFELLSRLRSASRKVESLGRDDVRGYPTERLRLTVDRDEADLPTSGGDDDTGDETLELEVWIDGDGLIRRVRFEDPSGTDGVLEFFDFGVPVQIEPPPPDEVSEPDEVDPVHCATGEAAPLTEETVTRVLREHGIGIGRDVGACYDEDDVAELINLRFDGADRETEHGAIRRREGVVWCSVRKRPRAGAGTTVRRSGEDTDAEIDFALANLECAIFPEGDAPAEQARRLARAFAALEKSLD